MSKRLNVPLVAQQSSYTCWQAAAQMLWWYSQGITRRQGPMYSLNQEKAISPAQFVMLAERVGLKKIKIGKFDALTAQDLEGYLTKYGPIWCAGFWFGVGHIIVLTGVENNNIYFNDPDGGVKKMRTVAWFNSKLSKNVDGCMMYKDPNRY